MSMKEAFDKAIKINVDVTDGLDETFQFDVVTIKDKNIFFMENVLAPAGVTLDQYLQVQRNITEYEATLAEYLHPMIKEQFQKPELNKVQVQCRIYGDEDHTLDINQVVHRKSNCHTIDSDVTRDSDYVTLPDHIHKLYASVNN